LLGIGFVVGGEDDGAADFDLVSNFEYAIRDLFEQLHIGVLRLGFIAHGLKAACLDLYRLSTAIVDSVLEKDKYHAFFYFVRPELGVSHIEIVLVKGELGDRVAHGGFAGVCSVECGVWSVCVVGSIEGKEGGVM